MNKRRVFLLLCTLFALKVAAQQNRISLKASSQSLQAVIEELTKKYGLQFAYSSSQVNLSKRITVDIKDETPEEALKIIFDGTPIAFHLQGTNVVLYARSDYKVTLSGYIREKGSGELLIGAVVSTIPPLAGAVTNGYGFYSITLPADTYSLQFQYTGYKSTSLTLSASESKHIDMELEPATNLEEVVISSRSEQTFRLNNIQVPIHEIRNVPMIMGEKDVVKYIMLSPGVQKGNEGNAYMYVRGGGPDQNLVLIDDAVIYNAYHFLGLSSLFSGNELRRAELIKGGFSAKYGGRLSSVLDMSMKDGNRERYGVDATIGIISSRLMVEGPIVKNKASFLISARRSYIDQALTLVTSKEDNMLPYSYYDIHAKLSTDLGRKDRMMFSLYKGNDAFIPYAEGNPTRNENGIIWGNEAFSLRWNHEFNGKLFLTTSAVYSYYRTRTALGDQDPNSLTYYSSGVESTIRDYTLKADLEYQFRPGHLFKVGGAATRHRFNHLTSLKNNYQGKDTTSSRESIMNADECYAYAEWGWQTSEKFSVTSGVRYSFYNTNQAYNRVEPRLKLTYNAAKSWQLQASYVLMNQYLHLLSAFSNYGFPNDMWVSCDNNLKPQRSHLFTTGSSWRNLFNRHITLNTEVYYKQIENIVSLKEGYSLFSFLPGYAPQNSVASLSSLATQGQGRSYGAEILVKKEHTRFEAWISYTISRTTFLFNDINRGRRYLAGYDRTHDIGIFFGYTLSRKFKLSSYWVYGTGNPISLPSGEYHLLYTEPGSAPYPQQSQFDYEEKNTFRMRSYHRLDVSLQYQHIIGKRAQSNIELSVYNVYNRANPFFYDIAINPAGKQSIEQLSLFPVIPSISWSITF